MLAVQSITIVMKDYLIPDACLLIDHGIIIDFGERSALHIPEEATVIVGAGLYAGPGLIDIHTHAGGQALFTDQPEQAAAHLLDHGITAILPALYFSLDKKGYLSAIDRIERAMSAGSCPNVLGLYMEGPYLNPKFGADRLNNPWTAVIKQEQYLEIVDRVAGTALIWALAPEREGIEGFVQYVRDKIPGIVFSVAHSEASPKQIEALIPLGLHLATHHTNATGNLQKYPEVRGVSVDETVNYHDDIYAELICDSCGIHVAPYMLRLIRKIKGNDRLILISDAYVSDCPAPSGYDGVQDINFDNTGEIAGSRLTLDVACRNMMTHTGCSLCDVFQYASGNPARLLGMTNLGAIRRGCQADIILVDHWMNVKLVIKNGAIVRNYLHEHNL
jgi:N-acetylglucosamine-6-phosphate deacetylase